jgi:hypothetical protein
MSLFLIPSPCKGEDEGEGPYSARIFCARFRILPLHSPLQPHRLGEKRLHLRRTVDHRVDGGEYFHHMRNYFISKVGRRGAILFGAAVFAAVAAGLHSAEGQTQPSAPDSLKPPASEHLRAHAHASGQQIYTCDGSKWMLSGPDAKLFDEGGRKVGSHFAGPTWQWSDGSQVTAKAIANATPDPESIPWFF